MQRKLVLYLACNKISLKDNEAIKYHFRRVALSIQAKVIAFYLPQFHPFPENDRWWGKGFTEWTNVSRATPMFEGHYQPHVPADLGFYDLRVTDVLRAQTELARAHSIYGFSFYYYWFNGKTLLHKPVENFLAASDISFPFCLTYANENWTRRWDGNDSEILIAQKHSLENERKFARSLIPYLQDERYIRVNGKALLSIYKATLFPNINRSIEIWRDELSKSKIELYLCRCETASDTIEPHLQGFDAALEFPPHPNGASWADIPKSEIGDYKVHPDFRGLLRDYRKVVDFFVRKELPTYNLIRGAMVGWDNTPRRMHNAVIYTNSDPQVYAAWLSFIVKQTAALQPVDRRFIFVNAWNEWAEGAHLEPCAKYGTAYLKVTAEALAFPDRFNPHQASDQGDDQLQDKDNRHKRLSGARSLTGASVINPV
jgi:lipopolysaccharide biosynthesis protein